MVCDFYPPFVGGVEVAVRRLSQGLAGGGHDVAVATLAAPGLPRVETVDGIRIHRIRSTTQRADRLFASSARPWAPPVPDPEAVLAIGRVLAEHRPQIVHGHDWLARSTLPHKVTRAFKLVMSLHYYTLTCPKKNLMYRAREVCSGPSLRKCLPCAREHYGGSKGAVVALGQLAFGRAEAALVDLFLPVSHATATASGLGPLGPRYTVVPNIVPAADTSGAHDPRLRELPAEPFLLFVGDVRDDKGANVLLEAYRSLGPSPPLVLIGKVWPETPRSLPPGAVLLRDWPNAAVRAAMQRCLALVVPSVWAEPFGIVVAESLAAGRPVVASRTGGIAEIVRDGREGLLVAPGDAQALARALRRIVADEPLREAMAGRATERARRFRPEAVLPLVEAAYREVLRSEPTRR
jgi:glycosyltransferase involved in cell wall biosynthesis